MTSGVSKLKYKRQRSVSNRKGKVGERLVRNDGQMRRTVCNPQRIHRVAALQLHRAAQATAHVEGVHDEPPATWRGGVKALDGEPLGLLLGSDGQPQCTCGQEDGEAESAMPLRTRHELSRRRCSPDLDPR
jgi:hypothetical protein